MYCMVTTGYSGIYASAKLMISFPCMSGYVKETFNFLEYVVYIIFHGRHLFAVAMTCG